MNEYHCHSLPLKAFVNGLLSDEESERLILHTHQCESCFEKQDQLWQSSQFTLSQETPPRNVQAAGQLERQVFRSLHQEVMWGQFIWLATKGVLQVFFGLLGPLFNLKWKQVFKKKSQTQSMAASSALGKE